MSIAYAPVRFPSPFAPKSVKDTEDFGREVAKAVMGSSYEYVRSRNRLIARWRRFAEGKQPVQPYLDQMGIDGKALVTNIRFKPRPIASKFEEVVVNGYMLRKEFVKCTAMSKEVFERKDRRRADAKFRMEYAGLIQQQQEETGIRLEDPEAFVPDDPGHLDIYFNLNDREIEEVAMQKLVNFALQENKIEKKKQRFLSDIFQASLAGYYNYVDASGRARVDYIPPEDALYGESIEPDFSDAEYKGRFLRWTVSRIREEFALTEDKEKNLFKAAIEFSGRYNNPDVPLIWSEDYRYSGVRPYDNYTVDIVHIWWACSKVVEPTVEYKGISKDNFYPETTGTEKKVPRTAYEGMFLVSDCTVLTWKEQRNKLIPGEDFNTLLCPFIFNMPHNKGRMKTPSQIDKMTDSIETMDLAILKIKMIIAKAAPEGYIIDIDSLMDIDLGGDIGAADPLTLEKIYQQTGNIYYKSRKDDGVSQNQVPVLPNLSPFSSRIETLIGQYNFELNCIRDYLGINEYREGNTPNPRTGFRVLQAQLDSSNTVTWSIYNAYVKATEELARQLGIRIWWSLLYDEPNKGYVGILGSSTIDMLKHREDITRSSYDIKYEIEMEQYQRDILEQNIQTCLANGTLEISDAMMIRRIYDYKVAEQYLMYYSQKRKKEAQQISLQNAQAQAQSTAMAGQAVEEAKANTAVISAQAQTQLKKVQGEQERDLEMEKLVWDLIRKQQEGRPIPPEYQPLVDLVLTNRGSSSEKEVAEKEMEAEQEVMQQQAQMAMEQQMV